jgi:hypothetical protein
MTLDQLFESFQRASMSSIQMQQEMLKQWSTQWRFAPPNMPGVSVDWVQKLQKRCLEFSSESLNRQRELVDSMYKSLIQLVEQTERLSDSKTPEDYRRTADELRQKIFETFKDQSDAQLKEFQKTAEKWFDVMPTA